MANPYLQDQANAITTQATQNLQRNILPSINSGAVAAGGFGGSRQGIAQGLAIGGTNQGLTNSLANLYGNAYQTDQQNQTARDLGFGNLALGNKQADNSFTLGQQAANTNQFQAQTTRDLGFGSLDANRYQFDTNTDRQAANDNFGRQLAGAQFNQSAMNNAMNWQQMANQWAQQQHQQPINDLTSMTNIGTTIGGQGGTSSTPYTANPWLGFLGGAQLGGQWGQTKP